MLVHMLSCVFQMCFALFHAFFVLLTHVVTLGV